MTKEEKSLLLFFESCCVESGGLVDTICMNSDDFVIAEKWKEENYIGFGRIKHEDITHRKSSWVTLSDKAWKDAHKERLERSKRIYSKRKWRKTEER